MRKLMKKIKLSIRPAQKKDVPKLAEFFTKAIKLMGKMSPRGFGKTLKNPPCKKKEEQRVIAELKDKNQITFVASNNGNLAGYITGCVEKYSDDMLTAPYLTIAYIYVDDKYRLQGIAKDLMKRLAMWGEKKGIKTMELTVWSNNESAKALFKNSGYTPLQIRMAMKIDSPISSPRKNE